MIDKIQVRQLRGGIHSGKTLGADIRAIRNFTGGNIT